MRVYQINVVCGAGSTGRIVVDLSRAIQMAGGECRIAYGRGTAPADVDAVKISNGLDLYYHAVMTRVTDRHGLYSRTATKKLIKDITQYAPDMIHLHNIHGYYVNYEMLFQFLKEYKRPVVWTLHDCWAFTGHCAHYDSIGCKQWKTMCENCPDLKAYPTTYTARHVSSNFQKKKECFSSIDKMTLVTPSKWLKSQVEESFLGHAKCVVIQNGIDIKQFSPKQENVIKEKLCPNREKLILGVTGVWTKNKGYDDFFKLRKLLNNNYVMCMVGLNDQQMTELPSGIIGVKRTESIEELAEYYSVADVFLNLTYEDTFPTTNIEALACGTPVLTYRTGGSPEIIDEACGAVVEKGDLSGMAKAVEKWCADKKTMEACLSRGQMFDKTEKYSEYVRLYGECIKNEDIVSD